MPRKSPFLDMTNLYNEAGEADELSEMLVNNPEAYLLFKAQIAYRRGDIDAVYDQARYFLSTHSGFYAIVGGGTSSIQSESLREISSFFSSGSILWPVKKAVRRILSGDSGLSAIGQSILSTARKASLGTCTVPNWRMRFLPSFCFSSSFFLRVMSPP